MKETKSKLDSKQAVLSAIRRVAEAQTVDFLQLVSLSGLAPEVDFIGADLSGVDLSNKDLRNFNFTNALFIDSDLRGANLSGTGFSIANATGATLDECTVYDGSVSLAWERLSREGEIAIAKWIEAARDMISAEVLISPSAVRRLGTWLTELQSGTLQSVDLVNLYAFVEHREAPKARIPRPGEKVRRPKISMRWQTGLKFDFSAEADKHIKPYVVNQLTRLISHLGRIPHNPKRALPKRTYTKREERRSGGNYENWRRTCVGLLMSINLRDERLEDLTDDYMNDREALQRLERSLEKLADQAKDPDLVNSYIENSADTLVKELSLLSDFGDLVERSRRTGKERVYSQIGTCCSEISLLLNATDLSRASFLRSQNLIDKGKAELIRAKEELLRANFHLVSAIEQSYASMQPSERPARLKAGKQALAQAVDTFTHRSEDDFETHAMPFIEDAMMDRDQE